MILTDYFRSDPDRTWDFAVQCGVSHGVIRLPDSPDFDITNAAQWRDICGRFEAYGIKPVVLEPIPNRLHDHIKAGDELRDASIDQLIRAFPIMRDNGITTVCFNFMAHIGWLRTASDIAERGGAMVTGFDMAVFNAGDYGGKGRSVSEAALWDNYEYFIRAVMPEAERYGIRMALHPDDPPVARLGNVSRIMISADAIRRALAVVKSDYLGITMCQATYHMMGADVELVTAELADKIFFIHFRNCRGDKYRFSETFHDNGELDMAGLIRNYIRCGIDVPIRVDHVPLMAGETGENTGYNALGRLYAIGYLRGLLEMCECDERSGIDRISVSREPGGAGS